MSRFTATNKPSVMHKIALNMRVKNEYEKAIQLLTKVLMIKKKIHKGEKH